MTTYSNNQKPVVHQPAAICDTYETILKYVSSSPCIFISAYNGSEYSKQLSNAIMKSDLTYIKCRTHDTDAFCIVNNAYRDEDFIRLGIWWCRKHETKSVLITFPMREKVNQRRLLEITGKVYNGMGQVKEKLEFGVPFMNTKVFFCQSVWKVYCVG